MSLVSAAMRRPVTVAVLVVGLALLGAMAALRMQRDVFPELGVPTIYVAQPYGGMDPGQMEGFITNYYEYHFLYINGIEHVESKNIQGVALIKLQFHPGTNMASALAETVSRRITLQPVAVAYVRRDGLPVTRAERPMIAWYGDMDLAPHLAAFARSGPIDVVVVWGEPIPVDAQGDRKRLTAQAEAAVRAGLLRVGAG